MTTNALKASVIGTLPDAAGRVMLRTETLEGPSREALFEQMERLDHRVRHNAWRGWRFADEALQKEYENWYRSLGDKEQFMRFYRRTPAAS